MSKDKALAIQLIQEKAVDPTPHFSPHKKVMILAPFSGCDT